MEIGSEFSYYNTSLNEKKVLKFKEKNYMFTFSGRSSIETVLKSEVNIKKVLLPSYCCEAMLVPFRKNGIIVDFYEVYYQNELKVNINIAQDIDAILWCNYFGFEVDMPDMTRFIDRGGIVIEDITHSLLSNQVYHQQSTYLIGSVRKWVPVLSGGICVSLKGCLNETPQGYPEQEYIDIKKRAMIQKQKYILGDKNVCKEEFLEMFSESNKWLANNYSGLKIDEESMGILNDMDWDEARKKRSDNAIVLYNGLNTCKNIKPLFDVHDMNCPLFVPVIVNKEHRQSLRKYLTVNEIYCPIHWPKPNDKCESNLYDIELSLICDQRYNEKDMQRMIDVIKKWDTDLENIKKER